MLRRITSKHTDGSYEEGAFCLLSHKKYNQEGRELVMVDTHHGLVLSEFEKNFYNDSDFYAIVWDVENNCPKQIQYASTRGWSYDCGCVVDATDEIKALYTQWQEKVRLTQIEYKKTCSYFIPKTGMTAKSKTTKGKAKGLEGLITWIGDSNYSNSKCVRIEDDKGYRAYVDVDRIELWHPVEQRWVRSAHFNRTFGDWLVDKDVVPFPQSVTL